MPSPRSTSGCRGRDKFLHARLADAAGPQRVTGKKFIRQFAFQQRHDLPVEHRAQLARRAGQHDQPFHGPRRPGFAVPQLQLLTLCRTHLHRQSRRGAHGIQKK
jgi:hypothetical protein